MAVHGSVEKDMPLTGDDLSLYYIVTFSLYIQNHFLKGYNWFFQ